MQLKKPQQNAAVFLFVLKSARLFAIMERMKKILYVLVVVALLGCSEETTGPGFTRVKHKYSAEGIAQYGFFVLPKQAMTIQMGNREEPDWDGVYGRKG